VTAINRFGVVLALLAAGCLVFARGAFAQSPSPAVEIAAGSAAFVDESAIGHGMVAGAARWQVTPRLGIGPEISYMRGPGFDRDLLVTGNVTWDFVGGAPRRGLVVPYVVGGAGLFRHSDRFGAMTFASREGAFTAGGGVRAWVSRRVYIGAEARVGWELHTRVAGTVGVQLGR
jgi:hypothetical protein